MKRNLLVFSFVLLMKRKCVFTTAVVSVVILGTIPITAYALTLPDATYWQGPLDLEADWFSGSNWDKGVPGPSDDAAIDNGGIARITSGIAVAGSLYLGPGTTIYPGSQRKEGHLVQSDGSLTISNRLYLSPTTGTSSSYTLRGGDISSQELKIQGDSLFQQSGGSNSTGNLMVAGTSSTYKLESGMLTVTGEEKIDNSAIFEQTGGNHVAGFVVLGSYPYGDKGHYALKGGALSVDNNIELSDGSTFQHSGGSSNISVLFNDGDYSLSQTNANISSSLTTDLSVVGGTFTQSGGEHNVSQNQFVQGLYTLSGGINTIYTTLEINDQGMYRMIGGSLTASRINVGDEYGSGTLEVASGCTVSAKGGFWRENTIRTFGNSSVDLTQGGKVLVGNVDTGLTGAITIGIDGVLEGTGTIIGNVSNQGIVRSGLRYIGQQGYSPGMLTITGDYEQESDGILTLFMAGSDADSFSQIFIDGQADIAGELSVHLIDGFIPNIGDIFEILNASSCYGNFSLLNVVGLPDDMFFDIEYGSNNVVLDVVPEPATLALVAFGGILLRKRKR